ncbi:MAG: hypothetical protein Q8P56_00800 [Candidatus Uhrbacteria bacterium]|nr:hypothetical protein [Candidatus Uhrbacteria bacterium]
MRLFVFFCLLGISLGVAINSPVPSEAPFILLFACMFALPFRYVVVIVAVVAFILDLFSSLKGLSLFSYTVGIMVCFFLSRHLLTNRSLPAFFVLGLSGWFALIVCKWLLYILLSLGTGATGIALIFSLDSLVRLAQGFFTACALLVVLYPLAPEDVGRVRFLSFSRSRAL